MASEGEVWGLVDQEGFGEHWTWLGTVLPSGYESVTWGGRTRNPARVVWEITRGRIPAGYGIVNTCGERLCVNPAHHVRQTKREQGREGYARAGLTPLPGGEDHPRARLTLLDVREIRSLREEGTPQREIASLKGVSQGTVWGILSGRTWRGKG